ncbi:MAG: GLPGLI family protein [Saprospiraceae bacterium]
MKQILLLTTVILVPWLLAAQATSGEITYKETIKIQIELPDGDEELKKMIPPSQSAAKVLVFNETVSLYKNAGAKSEGDVEVGHEEEGRAMKFVMKRPESILFTDIDESATVHQQEFFGRDFLVTGPARECKWKLTGEKKKIGDYECQKALLQDTASQVVAWFTPQIPVSAGPGGYGMLPGLILELDIDNGQRTTIVTKVDLKAVGKIEKPSKGKKVTADEFKAIEAEKMKEMGVEMGGQTKGVRMIIRTEDTGGH